MFLETSYSLGMRVARWRHVELHAVFFDHGDDLRVTLGSHAVPEAHGSHGDRLTDTLRPSGFAGMNSDIQAQRSGDAERVFVQDWRMARLVAGQVESDDALAHVSTGDLRERHVLCRRQVPQRRHYHATLEPEGFFSGRPAAQHRSNHVRERETMLDVQPGPVSYLGISHVIVLEILAELVGRSLERGHGLQHGDWQLEVGDVLNERRRPVSGLEKVGELSHILCRQWNAALLGQLQDGLGTNRAVEMEMQLGLGDRLKVGGVVHRRFRRMLPAAYDRRQTIALPRG